MPLPQAAMIGSFLSIGSDYVSGMVLVTGATGFTGSHLSRRLAAEGSHVVAFVRPGRAASSLEAAGVEVRRADITDRASVDAAFGPFETVYHLAAAFRTEHPDRAEFGRTNVEGTRHLLEAARTVGVKRFVHCSTVGVHGEIRRPPGDERGPLEPADHYQRSKLAGEQLARRFGHEGMDVTVVRPAGIYGPGDTRFLKLFRAVQRGRFAMIGSGQVLYHLTHIDDLVQGLLLSGRHAAASGETFILAGPRWTTLRELVDLIAQAVGRVPPRFSVPVAPVYAAATICEVACRTLRLRPPIHRRSMDFFTKDRAFDITRARTLIGYDPVIDPRDGLATTAAWYRDQKLI